MITLERLYIAARRGEPARNVALLSHMSNHAAARPSMDSRDGDAQRAVAGPNPACIAAASTRSGDRSAGVGIDYRARPTAALGQAPRAQALVQHRQRHSRLGLPKLQRARETACAGRCYRALLDEGGILDQVPGVEKHCAVPQCVAALRWSLWIALACEHGEVFFATIFRKLCLPYDSGFCIFAG
jgi:hypothetical protein